MVKIDFYLISGLERETAALIACRLTEKAYQQKQAIYIHTDSQKEAEAINTLLWTFRDISFIPHQLLTQTNEQKNKAAYLPEIGYPQAYRCTGNIIINLTPQIPNFFEDFLRLIEIIPQDSLSKNEGRKKYKIYREKGYELSIHDLTRSTASSS